MSNPVVRTDEPPALEREAQAWVVRLDSQTATVEDAAAFKHWCEQSKAHATAFAQARQVWEGMRTAALNAEREARDRRIDTALVRGRQPRELRIGRRAFLGGALAASAAYLALRPPLRLWPSVTEFAADYRTATGEQREVVVAHGMVVQMNTQTRINVRPQTEATAGIELLEGEAEIQTDVRALARLVVAAGDGSIRAAAGRFNIRHTGAEVCVTCLEGHVEIEYSDQRAALDAHQQLTYGARGLGVPRAVDATAITAWRQRQLVFDQVPLSVVVDEINRYRPGRIILTNAELGRSRVQASFSIDKLEDATALIRDVYGAELTRLPGGIVLLGRA